MSRARIPLPPPHTFGLVLLGGMAGTAARFGASLLLPPASGIAWGTLLVNVLGAFALGVLLERLLPRAGAESPRARDARVLWGTGFLGGFTTYSALSMDTVQLLAEGRLPEAAGYALGTVVLGAGAAVSGIALAGRMPRRDAAEGAAP